MNWGKGLCWAFPGVSLAPSLKTTSSHTSAAEAKNQRELPPYSATGEEPNMLPQPYFPTFPSHP